MKRAGLIIAVTIVALLLADAALAAGRISRSSRGSSRRTNSEEDKDTRTTVGNVRRVGSGNVRRTSDSSTSRTVRVVSTPKVSTSSSRTPRVSRTPTTSRTSRVSRTPTTSSPRVTTRPRVVSARPGAHTTPAHVSPTRPRISTGRSLIEATSTIERTGSGRPTVRPGNVHSSGGNVQFAGKVQGRTPRRPTEQSDSDDDGHHHHQDWHHKYTIIHIWDDDDDYPPWDDDETIIVINPQIIYDQRTRIPQKTFIPRSQISDAVITVGLPLTRIEWQRARALISRGIIRNVLDGAGTGLGYGYELDARWSRLNLKGPSEQVAVIETMIRDVRTFQAMTQPNRYGYSAAVIPVVSPFYLESDARAAAGLAGENFDAIRRMLQEASWRYAYSGKACWLNAGYGTVTIVDERENIQRAIALMNDLPFVPRDMVHE